jgi:hypothetical protein
MNEVDISRKNVVMENDTIRKCDYKCSYSFSYPETNVVAINSGDFLTLTCENYNNRPAKFNGKDYNVNSIMIFSPSLHIFRSQRAKAELIIEHFPSSGGASFYVCLPISENYNSSAALAEIISQVSLQANEKGGSVNINKTDFTLQNIVPMKPYYFYEGVFGVSEGKFIVYDMAHGLTLDSTTLMNLSASITANSMQMLGGELSLNPNGPSVKKSNDMYISCRPVGTSEDTVAVQNQKTGSSATQSSSIDSKTVTTILMYVGIALLVGAIVYLVHGLLSGKLSPSSLDPSKLLNPAAAAVKQ